MANGHPQIGGSNGVPLLDLGQPGGSRQGAGTALFSGRVNIGPDEAMQAVHQLPQQTATFVDNLGFTGRRVTLNGTIRASSKAVFEAIIADVNERITGSLRDANSGELLAADPGLIKETTLTDYDGTVISTRARLGNWRPRSQRFSNNEWACFQQVSLEFECLD